MFDKKNIRSELKSERSKLTAAKQTHAEHHVCNRVKCLMVGGRGQEMPPKNLPHLFYAPIHKEVPTRELFEFALKSGNATFFPRVQGDHLVFYSIDSLDQLEVGTWNLEPTGQTDSFDPTQPGIVFVPGVAFTRTGHRLGYGKGFYDRFLEEAPKLMRIGLAYDFQMIQEPWDDEAHDEPLDYIITPSSIWGSPRPRF